MDYYILENLNNPNTKKSLTHPSQLSGAVPSFTDKEKFREWCIDEKTKHVFYTTFEGANPHQRISGGNPAYKMYGFVADYDGEGAKVADIAKLISGIKKKAPGGWSPTWISRTYSGKIRAVWEFERPIMCDNEQLLEKLINTFVSESKAKTLIKDGGWDSASANPAMMWELGTQWTQVSVDKIAAPKLEAVFFDIARKTGGPRGKVTIPMEVLADKVEELFPGRWLGEFEVGARGPLFWVDDGVDRVGAIVQEGGMWSYSTRAGKSFISWSEIFGEKFVKDYREKQLADAIEDTWFDGQKYWVKDGRSTWSPIAKEDFVTRLRLAGFSHKSRKQNDPASEIDEVVVYVQDERRIHGAAPFLFDFNEVVEMGPKRYINTHAHLRAMEPAGDGDPANWPHLFDWWNGWMDDPTSISYVMAWLQRFYVGSLEGEANLGHSLIIAGDADKGKSLFSTYILPKVFAGGADAGRFLMGQEAFNKELSQSPVWYIDDNTSGATSAEHRRFSEMLKKLSATPKVTVRAMWSEPVDIERRGRIVLTTNTDADSLAILPNLDGTILDKLMIVKMSDKHVPWFHQMSKNQIEGIIAKELPHALHWLAYHFIPPKRVVEGASGRFGINTYHHPDIISISKDLSSMQREYEMIEFWWKLRNSKEPWEGNVSALMGELETYEQMRVFTRSMNKVTFGRTLAKLEAQTENIEKELVRGQVSYKISL